VPATSSVNWALATSRITLSVIASTSVNPERKLA
jgi:hypothetical protein